MTALGSRVQMIHRCTVQRMAPDVSYDDSWGQNEGAWRDHLVSQICRCWFDSDQLVVAPGELIGVTARSIVFPLGTDVIVEDRIGDVTLRGAVIMEGPMTIDELVIWPDRLELSVRRPD